MYARYGKRVVDILLGLVAAIPALLVIALLGIIIKLDDPKGSVIFRQTRIGRNGRRFKILKLRTMRSDTPKHLPNNCMTVEDYRRYTTKFSRWLRRTSLDEVPQIINILKGDMSWVGPRPVIEKEAYLLEKRREAGLDDFRPGLTGWAQIKGRKQLSDEQKAELDAEYAQKVSFLFDLKCIFKTIPVVFDDEEEQVDRITDFMLDDGHGMREAQGTDHTDSSRT